MFVRISFFTVDVIEKRKITQEIVIEIEKRRRNVPLIVLLKNLNILLIISFNSKRGGDTPSPLFFL